MSGAATTVHATCVVLREAGILIRGPSRAGKSTLALALVRAGEAAGWFARLVGDDRVRLAVEGGRLVARPHPAIAGLIEVRGVGIAAVPHEPSCVLGLVVDLVEHSATRAGCEIDLLGVRLARIEAARATASSAVMGRLRGEDDTVVTDR